jgi:hypothetical protein
VALNPDEIVLMIGTNDLGMREPGAQYPIDPRRTTSRPSGISNACAIHRAARA